MAVFSETRKKRVSTLKLQISTPAPTKDVNTPPTIPVTISTNPFHQVKLGMVVKVFRFRYRLRKKRAKAKENQKLENIIFFHSGNNCPSTYSSPSMSPMAPPREPKSRAHHSIDTPMKKMVNAADVMPQDWISRAKSRAMSGVTLRRSVSTGKAMAPPPMLVRPSVKNQR